MYGGTVVAGKYQIGFYEGTANIYGGKWKQKDTISDGWGVIENKGRSLNISGGTVSCISGNAVATYNTSRENAVTHISGGTISCSSDAGFALSVTSGELYLTGGPVIQSDYVNGHKPAVTLTYTGTANDGTDYNGTTAPTKAGTYTVTATVADTNYNLTGTTTANFVVAKADPKLAVNAALNKTYGDDAFALNATKAEGAGEVSYSVNGDAVSVDASGNVTVQKAGTATITVSVAENANYVSGSQDVTVTVAKKNGTLTVTKVKYEVTYGDADFTIGEIRKEGESAIVYESSNTDVATVDQSGKVSIKNVGTATIKMSMAESTNYNKVETEVEVVVAPKSIAGAKVTLGDVLIENGKEQTQKIVSVMLDGVEVTYEVSGNTGTKNGAYSMTIKGIGNYCDEIKQSFVIAPAANSEIQMNGDGKVVIGNGTIGFTVENDSQLETVGIGNSPAAIIEMLVADGKLTAADLADIADGAKIDLVLTVKDGSATILEESREQIISKTDGYTVGTYLDITLALMKDGQKTFLTETGKQITITIKVPEYMLNKDKSIIREFSIVRNHNGTVEILGTTYDANAKTLIFQTDKFSDYAIIYKDTQKKNNATGKTNVGSARTGDNSSVMPWAILMLLAIGTITGLIVIGKRRRYTDK